MGGRFGKLATCYWVSAGYVTRFTPPEGSFVNFLAQMTNTVLRYRREKSGATAQPAPAVRIALPSRSARAIEISTVLSHDLRWIPTSLAKKNHVGARFKVAYRGGKTVPPAVTTSPIDRPFDRSSRLRSRRNGSKNTTIQPKSPFKLEIDLRPLGVFEGASRVNNNVPASPGTAVELPNRRSEPPTRWPWGRARSAAAVDASLHHWSAGQIEACAANCAGK